MSIGIFVLKTALLRYGIIIQNVKFDVDQECIVIEYTLSGQAQSKQAPFAEIEALFSESPARPPGASPGGDLPGSGPGPP